ncbi:nucleotidyltransferase family protein [Tenacibaculum sp. MEBiC06402]|uniref:nucleotidyltransferase family protein n=1 Tax=unclassified Tenacibaculum TaxID=2635139 RepID=UPI003B9BF467
MTYKEALFFIGKCLTINHEKHNKIEIENALKDNAVDWDNVVKVSTTHYVFPALYCNLKRADFLNYLPSDLVEYMKHITDLNRERNEQIIEQAKEINQLLLKNGITPIFLKGTGNLLSGLYHDIAERMIGDIDFLVDENNFLKAAKLLENNKYEKASKKPTSPIFLKHYPRMFNENKISAVEVHIEMLRDKASETFNHKAIKSATFNIGQLNFLGLKDQLTLSTMAIQHNDYGYIYKSISLRNCYDIFLMSIEVNNLECINSYNSFSALLNSYFALTSKILNTNYVKFKMNLKTKFYLNFIVFKLDFPLFNKVHHKFWALYLFVSQKSAGLLRFIFVKEFRSYYIKRLFS